MAKKLVSFNDAAAPGEGLPAAVLTDLNNVYTKPIRQIAAPAQAPIVKMVPACVAGHGWTVAGTVASSDLNATDQVLLGSQSIKVVTNGAAANGGAIRTLPAPVNASDCNLRIWVRYDDPAKLQYVTVTVGNSTFSENSAASPVNLGSTSDASGYYALPNSWMALDIPQSAFVGSAVWSAIQRVQIVFKDKSGGLQATGWIGGAAFVKRDPLTRYPNGVACLTFDDTYGSAFSIARPKMDAYGWRGTLFPIIDLIGQGGKLTQENIDQLVLQGWEVGAHADTNANHALGFVAMTSAQRRASAIAMLNWMRDRGYPSSSFAWPLGVHNDAAAADVRQYFDSGRLAFSTHAESVTPAMPYRLKSINAGSQQASLAALITQTVADKGALVITLHDIMASGASGNHISTANFDTLLTNLESSGIAVRTFGEFMRGV